jgi:hypothetical protein
MIAYSHQILLMPVAVLLALGEQEQEHSTIVHSHPILLVMVVLLRLEERAEHSMIAHSHPTLPL